MRVMWFGTKQFSRWVKVASPGPTYSQARASDRLEYLNSGIGIRQSFNARGERALVWNTLTEEQASDITDFAYGVYGAPMIYWVDPVQARRNVLNPAWSAPGLALKDAIPLVDDKRPTFVANPDQSRAYPYDMARYSVTATSKVQSFYIPVPPKHTAWVGAHGDTASTLGISIQAMNSGTATGAPVIAPVLGVNVDKRFSHSFAATYPQHGIQLSIQKGAGVITLAGLMVQILPTGEVPKNGRYILGEGQGGCAMETPSATPYHAGRNPDRSRTGLSVKMTEVETWL